MERAKLFMIRAPLTPTSRTLFAVLSFVLPVLVWCAVSYVPWIWHPMVLVSDPGSVSYWPLEILPLTKPVFPRYAAMIRSRRFGSYRRVGCSGASVVMRTIVRSVYDRTQRAGCHSEDRRFRTPHRSR